MPLITKLPYHDNSEALFESIRHLPYSCWLDSGKPYSHSGRFDIISALPSTRLVTKNNHTTVYRREGSNYNDKIERIDSGDPFDLLAHELAQLKVIESREELPFTGGAIGYFSYDLKAQKSSANLTKSRPIQAFADIELGIYHWSIIQDHQSQTAYLIQLESCDSRILQVIKTCLNNKQTNQAITPLNVESLTASTSKETYLEKLKTIQNYIMQGDCYQVNYAQCFKSRYSGDPYSAYGSLRKTMASPFSAYLSLGEQSIMSLSPERFLQTKNRQVLAQPIKGTAPRHKTDLLDYQSAKDLQASTKNQAENLMIVDLLRNDIGQHCQPGSIQVNNLFGLQSFPNVHHLVSDVIGRLRDNSTSIELLRDCFPGGSITGAPKKRAMEIINEVESEPRGVYCGSIGYINANGNMDTNIAIRTVSCDGSTLYCWGGGGIVADSEPKDEYQESLDKINAILKVLSETST